MATTLWTQLRSNPPSHKSDFLQAIIKSLNDTGHGQMLNCPEDWVTGDETMTVPQASYL